MLFYPVIIPNSGYEGQLYEQAKKVRDGHGRPAILFYPYNEDITISYTGYRYIRLEGYSDVKDFYSPDYQKNPPVPGEIDYRRTLYWNPNVKTDHQGKAHVSFYNNNSCKQPGVSAEGLTSEGIFIVN